MAASRSDWSSWSVSVITGATVTESPVWTPIGSMFSIEQTITALSATSRTTSSSISAQPSTERSTSTWPIGLAARARCEARLELLGRVRRAAALAAEGERRAQDHRQAQLGGGGPAGRPCR